MPDDFKQRGARDRARISLDEEHEVRYWTQKLGVTREQLEEVVRRVGHDADKVRDELGKGSR